MKHHTNYPVGDFLTRLKNSAMARNKGVSARATKQNVAVAEELKKLGYLAEVKKSGEELTVDLAFKNKRPVIVDVKLISKPGLRIYMGADEIAQKRSPSVYIVSTPKGILSSRQVVKQRVGGEVIAEIW